MLKRALQFFTFIVAFYLSSCASQPDFEKGLEAYNRGDIDTVLKEWEPLAEQGHVSARYNLGMLYYWGHNVSHDTLKAVRLLTPVAENGPRILQFFLSETYKNGLRNVPENQDLANEWRTRAEQNSPNEFHQLGVKYKNGQGVPQDYTKAIKWYTLAANQGLPMAQLGLGIIYSEEQSPFRDLSRAHMWFSLVASQGLLNGKKRKEQLELIMTPPQLEDAQLLLKDWRRSNVQDFVTFQAPFETYFEKTTKTFLAFADGNSEEAINELMPIAEKGYSPAQYFVGVMLEEGKRVSQDYSEALKWYNKAADKGFGLAQKRLGQIYSKGQLGIAQNDILAHMWFSLANTSHDFGKEQSAKVKEDRVLLEAKMTSDQIEIAKELAKKWIEEHQQ